MELNRIKKVLDEKGIKQTRFAEKLGKSFHMVNAYVCNFMGMKELIVEKRTYEI